MFMWRKTGVKIAYCGNCGGERGFRFPDPRSPIDRGLDRITAGLWSTINQRRLDRRRMYMTCTSCNTSSDRQLNRSMIDAASGTINVGSSITVMLVKGSIPPTGVVYGWDEIGGRDELGAL